MAKSETVITDIANVYLLYSILGRPIAVVVSIGNDIHFSPVKFSSKRRC